MNRRARVLRRNSDVCCGSSAPRNVVTISNRSYIFYTIILPNRSAGRRTMHHDVTSIGGAIGLIYRGFISAGRSRGNTLLSVGFGGARDFGFNFSVISGVTSGRPSGLTVLRLSIGGARHHFAFGSVGHTSGRYTGCFASLNVGGNSGIVLILGHRCRF